MSGLRAEKVAGVFVEFADTLVEEFDLVEFLQMVTLRASELFEAGNAGLLLADPHGALQFMAASDERTEALELFQVLALEGPCHDCFREGVPIVNTDLGQAKERWPRFAPRAVEAGFRSVYAFPLRLRNQVLGALNLFSAAEGSIQGDDVRVVQALADVATIGLLQERAIRRSEVLAEQLQGALTSRILVEQAKGAIAQARGCSVDEAFDLIRAYCRNTGQRLSAVALAVVNQPGGVDALRLPPSGFPGPV